MDGRFDSGNKLVEQGTIQPIAATQVTLLRCPYRLLDSRIFMMQPAKVRNRFYHAKEHYFACDWRIRSQRQVWPRFIVVFCIGLQHATKMRRIKDDQMIETFSADRADEPFNVTILPRTLNCGRTISYAHCDQLLVEY